MWNVQLKDWKKQHCSVMKKFSKFYDVYISKRPKKHQLIEAVVGGVDWSVYGFNLNRNWISVRNWWEKVLHRLHFKNIFYFIIVPMFLKRLSLFVWPRPLSTIKSYLSLFGEIVFIDNWKKNENFKIIYRYLMSINNSKKNQNI